MAKAEMQSGSSMEKDPRNGYSSKTKTFHSLRQPPHLPPETLAISVTDYVFSLLRSTGAAAADFSLDIADFIIDATADRSVTYSCFLRQVHSLTLSLPPLAKGQVALILSPPSPCVPVLYFALLSLGVVISPANPLATESELIHMIKLSNPVVAFADSSVSHKLPPLPLGTILLNSSDFDSILTRPVQNGQNPKRLSVSQSDSAAILYSSGTTGRVKGVELTHRNFIALIAGSYHNRVVNERAKHLVALLTVPLFHMFGFFKMMEMAAMADTMVLMERFDFEKMLRAVEKYRITSMPVSPPIVVKMEKSELTEKYDLSSLEILRCGGAPLGKDVIERFNSKFPNIILVQGYGLTETAGGGALMRPPETKWSGSVGRLTELMEAKIVNPMTREAMPPGQQGELWLRGPTIMKGYVGDKDATAATLDPEGWLKTGDLCYFDFDGFLCIVGRLKELIKYKAYQVPPVELELLLLTHPEIADAAVIPYPDEEAGEIPLALVVRKPDTHITAAQVIDFVARQVAPYKKIRRVSFIDSIPKNPAGKILRRELINQAVSGASARL